MRQRFSQPGLEVLLAAVLGAAATAGQTTTSAPASRPTVNYSDPAFGFELNLPADWDYDRTRFQEFKHSIGLLRGRSVDGRRGLQVMVFRSFPMKPFEDWVIDFGKASAELLGSPRVDWETWTLPPRAGAILSYTYKLMAATVRSHYLCVPFDLNTIWVLCYSGQVTSEDEARGIRAEFDHLASSLRVHYDPEQVERLVPAFERGQALLARLQVQRSQVPLDEAEHLYDLVVAGKPAGYMQRRISREEHVFSAPSAKRRYAKEGLRARESCWRFLDDGTVWCTRLDTFSSFDGQSELIESRQIQIPPPGVQPQELLIKTDQVVREADVLFSSYTTSRDRELPEPSKPVSVGPVYLDQAWVRLLPQLLLDGERELYALAVYKSEIRALISHLIQPLGQRKLEGYDDQAYAFEVREGFIDHPSTLYCDRRGTLLRLESGDVVLTRVSRDAVEQKYGRRRDEACARFQLRDE